MLRVISQETAYYEWPKAKTHKASICSIAHRRASVTNLTLLQRCQRLRLLTRVDDHGSSFEMDLVLLLLASWESIPIAV